MSTRPNPLPRFYVWLTYGLMGPLMLVLTAVCASTALLVSVVDKKGRMQHRIAHFWGRSFVRLSLSRLKIEGEENFHKAPVAVYASNHTSYMDTPVIFGSIPFQFRILAKKDLWQWPMIGWYLGRSGQMPIDLENPHATLSSSGGAVKALRAGVPLFVFP
jgi:1-acyl-sn-glycerol-3-phosphate acyltransferase